MNVTKLLHYYTGYHDGLSASFSSYYMWNIFYFDNDQI